MANNLKFLDYAGLQTVVTNIKDYVDKHDITSVGISDAGDNGLQISLNSTAGTVTGTINLASDSSNGLLSAADYTRLKGVEAGAQVNALERIVVAANGATAGKALDMSGKDAVLYIETALSDDTADVEPLRPASAKAVVDYVKTSVTSAISTLSTNVDNRLNALETTTATHTQQIGALQTADQNLDKKIDDTKTALEGQISTLSNTVSSNTSAIAQLRTDHENDLKNYSTTSQMQSAITDAIGALDNTVTASAGHVFTQLVQTDGVITASTQELKIEKLANATDGFASSYQLTLGGQKLGATIDIAKDKVVKSGEVKIVKAINTPYDGAAVGDAYIELVFENVDAPCYIPAKSLVTIYEDSDYLSTSTTADGKPTISLDYNALKSSLQSDLDLTTANELKVVSDAAAAAQTAADNAQTAADNAQDAADAAQAAADSAIKSIEFVDSEDGNKLTADLTTVGGTKSNIDVIAKIPGTDIENLFKTW